MQTITSILKSKDKHAYPSTIHLLTKPFQSPTRQPHKPLAKKFHPSTMSSLPTHAHVFRRTDSPTPHAPKLSIKLHALSLNYRDAHIPFGQTPWPFIPHGIPCNDAVGSVIALDSHVTKRAVGNRVAPNTDSKNLIDSTRPFEEAEAALRQTYLGGSTC